MRYTQTALDRSTGDLVPVDMGEWLTVTELGEHYGVGRNKIRSILQQMGLVKPEGQHGRLRLTPEAVRRGLGKRHDKPKSGKYPFDVLSPAGQALIASRWQETIAALDASAQHDPLLREARSALSDYVAERRHHRLSEMEPQMQICWLLDHFRDLTGEHISKIVGVTHQLVSRYADRRAKQLDYFRRRKASDGLVSRPEGDLIAEIELDDAPEASLAAGAA